MRRSFHRWLLLAAGTLGGTVPAVASSTTEAASPLSDVSVTVYRAADRNSGSLDLDDLGGFALVTETRTISIPAGVSRLRVTAPCASIIRRSAPRSAELPRYSTCTGSWVAA